MKYKKGRLNDFNADGYGGQAAELATEHRDLQGHRPLGRGRADPASLERAAAGEEGALARTRAVHAVNLDRCIM